MINVVLVLLITAISVVWAPLYCVADENRDEEAITAFQHGIELFDNGEFEAAAVAFRKANELNFNWRIFYNIGQSEASSKRYGLALEAFEAYLAHAGDEIDFARRDEVLAEVQRLKLMVGSIEVVAPVGAIVFIDGEVRGETPLAGPVLVPSGILHTIEIRHQTDVLFSQKVKMNSGQTRKISVPTSPAAIATTALNSENPSGATSQPAAAKPTEITENTALSRRKTLSVALMAVGGAAIASGAVTGIVAMKRGKQLESNYPNGVPDSETDKMDSVDKLALTTDILMGVGIVSAAIGTILLLRSKKDRALAPVPVIGSGVAGLQLEGRF